MKILRLALISSVLLPATAFANPTGLTWHTYGHDSTYGVDTVGCDGDGDYCNAYTGDTSCTFRRPILCINVDGSNNPGVATTAFYFEWAYANIATTHPIRGSALTSRAVADEICAGIHGSGWRMAEHHDGAMGAGGWAFLAFGHVRDDVDLWVAIDDQPANCWD